VGIKEKKVLGRKKNPIGLKVSKHLE